MPWINPSFIYHFHVGQRVAIPERGTGRVVEVLPHVRDCDGQLRTAYRVWLDCGREFWGHPDNMSVITDHHDAMLTAGWIAVRSLSKKVVAWKDPTDPKNTWCDEEAYWYWRTGDRPSVPRLRRPEKVTNGGHPAIAGRKAEESSHVSNSECSSRTR